MLKNESKYRLPLFSLIAIISLLLLFGIGVRFYLKLWGKEGIAVVEKAYSNGLDKKLVFLVDNKVYFESIEMNHGKVGSLYEINYCESYPDFSVLGDWINDSVCQGQTLFYLEEFPEGKTYELRIYSNKNVSKKYVFQESFGIWLDKSKEYKIEVLNGNDVLYSSFLKSHDKVAVESILYNDMNYKR